MADWQEIKRLAADLQRAQLSGSAQRYVMFSRLVITRGMTAVEGVVLESMQTYVPVSGHG